MREWLSGSAFFALLLTLGSYELGRACQQKWKSPLLNPILLGACLTAAVLLALGVPNASYQQAVAPLQLLLTPATICFAIPFYCHLQTLKAQLPAICIGTAAGTLMSLCLITALCRVFGLDTTMLWSLLPKSITTAIGVALCEEAGGIAALTTAAIIATGILGNLCGPALCRLFHLRSDAAKGVAFGTASHAIGTSKALELSELAGAAGSFALTLAGLLTTLVFTLLFSIPT